jgi:peptidoglycan/LPS O-acetylase OafA/YrhL
MELAPKNNLDFIRTLLALGVLSFHTLQTIGINYPQLPWVPAFIAISGYLITESMYRSAGYLHFAWKRLLRVGPAFVISLILVAVLGASVPGALLDWLSLGYRPSNANPPLWSLSLEEILYFCLAVWFALGMFKTPRRAMWGLCAIYFLAAFTSGFVPAIVAPLFHVTVCFVSGSFLYIARDRIPWSVPGALICLAAVVWLRNWPIVEGATYTLLIGPLIAYSLMTMALHTPPVFARYKVTVGDPSLGIYVYHFPILTSLKAHGVSGYALYPATLFLTVTLALISWHAVEKLALSKRMKSLWIAKTRQGTSNSAV